MPTYSRLPVVFETAEMQYLWDVNGKKYTDYIAGYGCLNIGHSNPFVIDAICKQASKIIQPSNVYYNVPQVKLAKKLAGITGAGKKAFFANSGTEAIESAVKLARKFSKENFSEKRYKIISFYKSFHGRTMGALSATAQEEKQKIFEPLVEGFEYAKLNDIDSVKVKIDKQTCAILVEPIQGEGGVNVAQKGFMDDLKKLCTENKMLLILDEVQTGFGRTGTMFAYQGLGIEPDILVLAKSIGGGMPLGAIIAGGDISSAFGPGSHGSTFGGNAVSCAAGCAVVDYMVENRLPERAKELGTYFIKGLEKIKSKYPVIIDVRGKGLMVGMEFSKQVAPGLVSSALEDGLVINKVSPEILRFLPPLIISERDIDRLLKWLEKNIAKIS
jgi:predicted acetylornithine/succinylornithine family transaminase